jgi:UDP-glucose 4-epimerase
MTSSSNGTHHPSTQTPGVRKNRGNGVEALSFYKDCPVLVTGGMGFIGSNLVHALVEAGAKVTVVDAQLPGCGWRVENLETVRKRIEFSSSDISDSGSMRPLIAGQRVIFNLAGEISHINSMADPARDLAINCGAQVQFLDLCRAQNPRATIVYASSRQVYGKPKYLPADEQHPIHPVDYNGVHKHAAEHYHFLLRQQFGMRTVSLRLGNTYGPRQAIHQDCRGFIDTFVRKALAGDQITVFGDGQQLRGMTYVEDVVDAFLRAGRAGPDASPVYNVGNPKPVSLLYLSQALCRIAGSPPPRLMPFPAERQAIDIGDFYPNTDPFCREFGWAPRVNLEQGLSRTIEYFRAHAEHKLHANPHPVS